MSTVPFKPLVPYVKPTHLPEWVCLACVHPECMAARLWEAPVPFEGDSWRLPARRRLARRLERLDLGLSNPAYLHAHRAGGDAGTPAGSGFTPSAAALASSLLPARSDLHYITSDLYTHYECINARIVDTQITREVPPARVTFRLTPSRARISFTDAISDTLKPARGSKGGRRGVITHMSDSARDRLADMACELTEVGKEPTDILTLTSPANWEDVYVKDDVNGGRLFKKHLEAFRMRLTRFFEKKSIMTFSALWFLEFQKRGAPHVHLILFDVEMTSKIRRAMRSWLGPAWTSIVGNPDKHEKDKHKRAGTQVAKMRKKHFGYAAKYAAKAEQKEVPTEFRNVGRFWGVWSYKSAKPEVIILDYTHLNTDDVKTIMSLVIAALSTVSEISPTFYQSRLNKVHNAMTYGLRHRFGFSVFGGAASKAIEKKL